MSPSDTLPGPKDSWDSCNCGRTSGLALDVPEPQKSDTIVIPLAWIAPIQIQQGSGESKSLSQIDQGSRSSLCPVSRRGLCIPLWTCHACQTSVLTILKRRNCQAAPCSRKQSLGAPLYQISHGMSRLTSALSGTQTVHPFHLPAALLGSKVWPGPDRGRLQAYICSTSQLSASLILAGSGFECTHLATWQRTVRCSLHLWTTDSNQTPLLKGPMKRSPFSPKAPQL